MPIVNCFVLTGKLVKSTFIYCESMHYLVISCIVAFYSGDWSQYASESLWKNLFVCEFQK